MTDRKIPLLLFAKAPIVGQVKTRLTTHCSDAQAAEIAKILMDETLKKAKKYWQGDVFLSVWNGEHDAYITEMCDRHDVQLHSQTGNDLGEKMLGAMNDVVYPVAILGCDVPLVSEDVLRCVHQLLAEGRNVVGPSEDGGYYLIGLSQVSPSLFSDIAWGSEMVLAETMTAAHDASTDLELLDMFFDVDLWGDVIRAAKQLPALQSYLDAQGLNFRVNV